MRGPYVHQIDPIIAEVGGIYLWWYGLSYTLGFLHIYLWLRRRREHLGLSRTSTLDLTLFFCIGVLAGGRMVEVLFDEWPFYREHPLLIPAFWLGGMATHGLMIGAAAGTVLFAAKQRIPFLRLADELVIPGALLMGLGRIGNFVDGQILGAPADVWWAIRFPDAEGFRHPVVLYDGLKNLLLVPFLLHVRRTNQTPGATAARFVFWYAFLRIWIDLFRDYPTHRVAIGTGQMLNIGMTLVGAVLLYRSRQRRLGRLGGSAGTAPAVGHEAPLRALRTRQLAFAALLAFCLTIPSNWTQDVPERYGSRHEGLQHSPWYPAIDTAPRGSAGGAGRQPAGE